MVAIRKTSHMKGDTLKFEQNWPGYVECRRALEEQRREQSE